MIMLALRKPGLAEKIIRLIYPVKCMICGKVLTEDSVLYLCDSCHELLPRCGTGFYKTEKLPYINGIFSAFHYENGIDKAIQAMKFDYQPRLSETLAFVLLEELLKETRIPHFDFIIPVPMHKKKMRSRGFNQSRLIADKISEALQIPVDTEVLVKTRNTRPQSTLKKEERLNNLLDAFSGEYPERVINKNILLVDDVITTGTTINSCGRILYENGAEKIYAVVIANAEKCR